MAGKDRDSFDIVKATILSITSSLAKNLEGN